MARASQTLRMGKGVRGETTKLYRGLIWEFLHHIPEESGSSSARCWSPGQTRWRRKERREEDADMWGQAAVREKGETEACVSTGEEKSWAATCWADCRSWPTGRGEGKAGLQQSGGPGRWLGPRPSWWEGSFSFLFFLLISKAIFKTILKITLNCF